ncbi:ankyrin repeat domain-containing protein [Haliscomenobacter sp.]|uniref:ankyrin repeat domain-containing protein n=1 Tax=Haliscomenobacter sp. TaxID=2717303 RepID=UPI003BAC6FE1
MIEHIFSPEMIYALGWTLIHTLWQGALFACLLAVTLIALRRYSAEARYVVAVGLLFGFFITTVFTFVNLYRSSTSPELAILHFQKQVEPKNNIGKDLAAKVQTELAQEQGDSRITISFQERMVNYYNENLPLIVTLWLLGVMVLFLRLLGQLAYVQRLKVYGVAHFPASWQDKLRELEQQLDLHRVVQYFLSYRVDSPMAFGWLRPVVLFPAGLFKTLDDTQIYAILAHELAHVKRNDFLANLLQRLLLTLFFYHPGLWWMSARIEEEREHSCDDLAVRMTKQPIGYAKTLLHLTETQMNKSSVAMGYQGANPSNRKSFKARITRLLSNSLTKASFSEGITTASILGLTLVIAVIASAYSPYTSNWIKVDINGRESKVASTENFDQKPKSGQSTVIADQKNRSTSAADPEFELFMEAINDGNLKLVKHFLEKGADVNGLDDNGFTPLMMAASEDQPEIAQLLIDKGAKVNFVNAQGWTALTEAADEGAYATAKVLLNAGADAHLKINNGVSPLKMAASEGHAQILQLLIDKGAKLSTITEGQPPLHAAAEEGQLEVVKMLLGMNADLGQVDEHGRTPLMYAAEEGQLSVVQFLVEKGAKVNQQDKQGRTALSYAAGERQTEVVRFLLGKGADLALLDENGNSALDFAARENAGEVVKILLNTKEGAKQLNGNASILVNASEEGALPVVRQLKDAGANVNAPDENGTTPLMAASEEGQEQVVQYLLSVGAEVNAKNKEGWTALAFAARENQPEVIQFLLAKKADLEAHCTYRSISSYGNRNKPTNLTFYQGSTPLMIAVEENAAESVRILLENRANANITIGKAKLEIPANYDWKAAYAINPNDPNSVLKPEYNTQGWTPLMEAAERGNETIIKLLLAAGADANAKTSTGMTAASVAQKAGNAAIVQLLQKR